MNVNTDAIGILQAAQNDCRLSLMSEVSEEAARRARYAMDDAMKVLMEEEPEPAMAEEEEPEVMSTESGEEEGSAEAEPED